MISCIRSTTILFLLSAVLSPQPAEDMSLNQSQLTAIHHYLGPMLVVASPGSGKTTVVIHRVKHLIDAYGVPPSNILTVTFSKAAAGELSDRYEQLCRQESVNRTARSDSNADGPAVHPSGSYGKPLFGTLHSIFFRMLRQIPGYKRFRIISEKEKAGFIRSEAARFRTNDLNDSRNYENWIREIINDLSRYKSLTADGETAGLSGPFQCSSLPYREFQSVYTGYRKYLKDRFAMDFDDILTEIRSVFIDKPDYLAYWQKQFPFILVDEFQDVNRIQYELLRMLGGTAANLFLVGDDDQSIYRFRGSAPGILRQFQKDCPDCRTVVLQVNYRCPDQIRLPAEKLIRNNPDRIPKYVHSSVPSGENSLPPAFTVRSYKTQYAQYQTIAEQISRYHKNGIPYRQMAILLRGKQFAEKLYQILEDGKIPCDSVSPTDTKQAEWISEDIQSYFRIAIGTGTRNDFLRIINRPCRDISGFALTDSSCEDSFDSILRYYRSNASMIRRILQLKEDLAFLGTLDPASALKYLRKAVRYDDYIQENALERGRNPADDIKEADALETEIQRFPTIRQFLSDFRPESPDSAFPGRETHSEGVRIMTIHAAKGLEFPVVFIPDLNQGILPSGNRNDLTSISEERRLLYVGMTRSGRCLHLSYADSINQRQMHASRFLQEIRQGLSNGG